MTTMQDLHLPSSTTATTSTTVSSTAPLSERLSSVLQRRSNLEAVLSVHYSTLSTNNNSTLKTPLVDPQGFPRSDIDVAAVRNARVEIIRGRNDLKAIEGELEALVKEGLSAGDTEMEKPNEKGEEEREVKVPFARVNSVAQDSPAQLAGLEPNDLIISISSVDSTNHENLAAVGKLVSQLEGKDLPVVVQRDGGKRTVLRLTPRRGWGGRGLLGCHIGPYP
ncbi:Nas2p [Sporobolomyces salmoneus]|uniref:Nas2p n=1 Tax=Sporobolomyces salmoneus TaxID=183962 RepID=UPI00317FDCCA